MPIDIDLLKKAFPDGYLAMRGVMTVGGWQCVSSTQIEYKIPVIQGFWLLMEAEGNPDAMHHPWGLPPTAPAILRGDLLPSVDPADTATWSCLLVDLAKAAGWPGKHQQRSGIGGFSWRRGIDSNRVMWWEIDIWYPDEDLRWQKTFKDVDTDDPAKALVLARIQLRDKVQ